MIKEKRKKLTVNECIFCKIINKEIPSEIVSETEGVLAFKDANPQAPVHILVIPKIHLSSITKVKKEHSGLIIEIIQTINNIAKKTAVYESGYRIIVNHGTDSGQAVPHLHFHILGGRKLTWPPG